MTISKTDAVEVGGLMGAVSPSRYVGATASGAPTVGSFKVGDFVVTGDGHVIVCTVAGTPGTWVDPVAVNTAAIAAIAGPRLLVPYGATLGPSAAATWYTANAATYMRVHVPVTKTYRYANLRVGVSSGNIQIALSSVDLYSDASAVYGTRLMTSGVIACPATGDQQVDLTSTSVPAGDYLLSLWCDNTTATFLHGLAAGMTSSRMLFSQTGLASGVPSGAHGATAATTTRWVTGLTLEAAT